MAFAQTWDENVPDGSVQTVSTLDNHIKDFKVAVRERLEGDPADANTGIFQSGSWTSAPKIKELRGVAGALTNVSYGADGDQNTGMYFPAADQMALAAGGIQMLLATATTVTLPLATTITAGGLTITAGGLTVTADKITMAEAVSQIVPGATSFAIRDTADAANNLIITDAGAATFRSTVGGITTLTATTVVAALTGNADTATSAATLTTPRNINSVAFDGSANITVTAAADTLTGGQVTVARGGTNITSYTIGDILYASATGIISALPIGAPGEVLAVVAGIPNWEPAGTPGAHTIADTTGLGASHTTSGLTAGMVLRATAATTAAFQLLVASDIPNLDTAKITTGTWANARVAAGNVTQHEAALTILVSQLSGTVAATQGGTGIASPTSGNLILGAGGSAMTQLAFGAAGGYARSTGSAWARSALLAADLTGTTMAAAVVTSSLTTVGALNAGTITSGFGNINNGTSTLNTGALTATTITGVGALSLDGDLAFVGAQAITTTAGDLTLTPSGDLILNAGNNFINETSDPNNTIGLTINQQANVDSLLTFKNTSINTGLLLAQLGVNSQIDDYANFAMTASSGGLHIQSLGIGPVSLVMHSWGGAPATTDTSASLGCIAIYGGQTDGSDTREDFAANTNLLVVGEITAGGALTTRMILKADDGELHLGNTTLVALDDYDDAQLVRAMQVEASQGQGVKGNPYNVPIYDYNTLREIGVLGPRDAEGFCLFAIQPRFAMNEGAIWQAYVDRQEMKEEIEVHRIAIERLQRLLPNPN